MVWLYKQEGPHEKNVNFDGRACTLFNKDNMMPNLPNVPLNTAGANLDTDTQVSSIPRADRNENWRYPSPMQFYNALVLKKKTNKQEAQYIKEAVRAHNAVNEKSWEKIKSWEDMHRECERPELRRFVGRYNDRTLKSYFVSLFSRCGKEIRYIIDYYDDPRITDDLQVHIDARPALDSFGNIIDRIRRLFYRH
ncbi:Holocytochrome c-c1 synthase [Babesia duncani]|uniref:Holocytochrome c-type synthase n=1 Tax=Babesia duncani TaxID=323732 RepID=A0AAD9PIA9_9APIC|nr:Holocytochrome c-c1 synthase [Babesia duncani]